MIKWILKMLHNKKNNSIISLIVLAILICTAGCVQRSVKYEYQGEYPELYSIAINSLLGAKGYYQAGEIGIQDPGITVIEEDEYGRKLFFYREAASVSTYNYIISQKSNDYYAYFYPDFNFISAPEKDFPDEEIEKLKTLNDWGMEINDDKCVRVEIVRKKPDGPVKISSLQKLYDRAFGDDAWNGFSLPPSYALFFIKDDYGRSIYLGRSDLLGYEYEQENQYRYIVMLFLPDGSFNETTCLMDLNDLYEYQDDLKQFKGLNDWNKPWAP